VPQERRDVLGGRRRVAEGIGVEVDLRRHDALDRVGEPGAELLLDHALELDRVQTDAAGIVGQRALPVVGGDDQRVLAREALLEHLDGATDLLVDRPDHQLLHFEDIP